MTDGSWKIYFHGKKSGHYILASTLEGENVKEEEKRKMGEKKEKEDRGEREKKERVRERREGNIKGERERREEKVEGDFGEEK